MLCVEELIHRCGGKKEHFEWSVYCSGFFLLPPPTFRSSV